MRRYRMWIVVTVVFAVFVCGFVVRSSIATFFYPQAASMPKNIDAPLEDVLARLDQTLAERNSKTHSKLQVGLTTSQIDSLESEAGVRITNEMRTLYSWHNGLSESSKSTFFMRFSFPPLEHVVAEYSAHSKNLGNSTLLQRGLHAIVSGHRRSWMAIFPDGAGDGYFVDLDRNPPSGAVFYHFTEMGHFVFYPSLKNLLAAIVECYESGIYTDSATGVATLESAERELDVHRKYGTVNGP